MDNVHTILLRPECNCLRYGYNERRHTYNVCQQHFRLHVAIHVSSGIQHYKQRGSSCKKITLRELLNFFIDFFFSFSFLNQGPLLPNLTFSNQQRVCSQII